MEMQVIIPSPAHDFNFDSTCTSPYVSAPSSPQRFGNYFFSAPTSPTRAAAFFHEYSLIASAADATSNSGHLSVIPFNWEEKPGVPKRKCPTKTTTATSMSSQHHDPDDDFAFDFSGQLERPSLSAADELFDGGKIKPLKPPPRLQYSDSPKSPKSPKKTIIEALSPRHRKKDIDPFSAAIEQARKQPTQQKEYPDQFSAAVHQTPIVHDERGRERTQKLPNSTIRHKPTRSLSPLRVSDMLFDPDTDQQTPKEASTFSWYKKWKLKDLLLFRSASEGHATTSKVDPLKKYAVLKRSNNEDVKNSSFRSTDSAGSVSRRRGPAVSAHEMHYTLNRAVSEEMRRKTFLPYKQGLLGCLGFNPAVHEISRGLGSSVFSRE
ncbi:hypothetical protein RJ640_016521 [Escallonia rubra]|uniref:Uncharacterized protein n=1 Tax=Escallonia rubra TaxID=112253 RepID=A0AA88URB7_9ASTE|nr:hypothetical protein RJ640_016521 [Escallonia rubra]